MKFVVCQCSACSKCGTRAVWKKNGKYSADSGEKDGGRNERSGLWQNGHEDPAGQESKRMVARRACEKMRH